MSLYTRQTERRLCTKQTEQRNKTDEWLSFNETNKKKKQTAHFFSSVFLVLYSHFIHWLLWLLMVFSVVLSLSPFVTCCLVFLPYFYTYIVYNNQNLPKKNNKTKCVWLRRLPRWILHIWIVWNAVVDDHELILIVMYSFKQIHNFVRKNHLHKTLTHSNLHGIHGKQLKFVHSLII